MSPQLTIHMLTYNRAHFIKQAIDSVLSQTFQDFELLILDDASTDNTSELIQPYLIDSRIKYIKNEQNLGITKNRNKALSLSQGEYIAVLDSDDYWTDNNKLQKQINFLNKDNDHVLVGTNIIIVDENNNLIKKVKYPSSNFTIKKLLLIKNLFCHSSVIYRKKEILDLGCYDENLSIWEDYDLWLKIGLKYKFANLNIFTTAYRRHGNQSNSEKKQIGRDAQIYIINKYKKDYNGYMVAKIVNKLRNLLNK
jgi:glycosyltransferase involved in cell wall biosynthesis